MTGFIFSHLNTILLCHIYCILKELWLAIIISSLYISGKTTLLGFVLVYCSLCFMGETNVTVNTC